MQPALEIRMAQSSLDSVFHTNVQSNPGTSAKWTDLAVGTIELPLFLAVQVCAEGKVYSWKFNAISVILLWFCVYMSDFSKYYVVKHEHDTFSNFTPLFFFMQMLLGMVRTVFGTAMWKAQVSQNQFPHGLNLSLSQNVYCV